MFDDLKDILTVEEVAEILRISKATVYTLIKNEDIKSTRVRHSIRIAKKDLEDFISEK